MAGKIKWLNVATVIAIVCYLLFTIGYLAYSVDGSFTTEKEY